jgi:hypothetical protein
MSNEEIIEVINQLKNGDEVIFSPTRDDPTVGKISFFNNNVYICQNKFSGLSIEKKYRRGYEYSWIIKRKENALFNEVHKIEILVSNKQFLLF